MWTIILKTSGKFLDTEMVSDCPSAKDAYLRAKDRYGDRVLCVVQGKNDETIYPLKRDMQ